MTFANPSFLWFLAAVPALALLTAWAAARRRRTLAAFGNPTTVGGLLPAARPSRAAAASRWGGLTLLAVAAAGPQAGQATDATVAVGRDVVVVLDVSGSMLTDDVPPSRLARARAAAAELIDAAAADGGHRLALVTFAAAARVECPLTQDADAVREKLAAIDRTYLPTPLQAGPAKSASGTRIGAALTAAVGLLDPRFPGCGDVVLLSDGDDPAGDDEWRAGVAAVRAVGGVRVFAVGVGDPDPAAATAIPGVPSERSYLHEGPLKEIAGGTGGEYVPAYRGDPRLGPFFRDAIAAPGLPRRELRDDPIPPPRSVAGWFLGPGLVLLAAAVVWGNRP